MLLAVASPSPSPPPLQLTVAGRGAAVAEVAPALAHVDAAAAVLLGETDRQPVLAQAGVRDRGVAVALARVCNRKRT